MAKKKRVAKFKLNWQVVIFAVGLILMAIMLLSLNQKVGYKSQAADSGCTQNTNGCQWGLINNVCTEKVPCTMSACGSQGCPADKRKITAGGSACCYKTAIGSCVTAAGCSATAPTKKPKNPKPPTNPPLPTSAPTATIAPNPTNSPKPTPSQGTGLLSRLSNCIRITCSGSCVLENNTITQNSLISCSNCVATCMGIGL